MKLRFRTIATLILLSPIAAFAADPHSVLVIVVDGLRPDYVQPDVMPNLHALGERGVVCANHHSVFPTVTRVNSSSFSTGCYPWHHGILGNTIYIPEASKDKPLSTGSAENLMKVEAATGGNLLSAPTLGEILEANGMKIFASSSGSSGSSFLLNSKVKGGGIVNIEMVLPESNRAHVDELLGPAPPEGMPSVGPNRRAIDAVLKMGIDELHANLTFLWITDPDHTAHTTGVGTPKTIEALKHVDEEIGRLMDGLKTRGVDKTTNVIVTSDHGFSTQKGESGLLELLVQNGLKKNIASSDVIISEGAIYVLDGGDEKIAAIVELLQRTDWVGAVFTRAANPGDMDGVYPGTFSFDAVRWDHARSGHILADANWSDAANEQGWKGTTMLKGAAGHGTSSPYDIHNTLIAIGPDVKQSLKSDVPTGNVDIAPTVCHLLGIKPTKPMDGRVVSEILVGGPDPASIKVEKKVFETERVIGDMTYRLELHTSYFGQTDYIDRTVTTRKRP